MAKKNTTPVCQIGLYQYWEEMGSPSLSKLSVHNGDLLERRHGLRKDDLVEILLDARAFKENDTLLSKEDYCLQEKQVSKY